MATIRYINNFKDIHGYQYELRIHEIGFSGSATAFKTASPGFELQYDGDGSTFYEMPIRTSRLTLFWAIENFTDRAFVEAIAGDPDGKYLLEVMRTAPGESQTRFWTGVIQNDGIEFAMDYYPQTVAVTATCGLARLGNIPFDYATANLTPDELIAGDVLLRALNYGATDQLYNLAENYLASSVDWWDDNQIHTGTFEDPIAQTKIQRASLMQNIDVLENETDWKPLSCLAVITNIMKTFGATIEMSNGVWRVFQPENYASGNAFDWFYYDKGSTFANLLSKTSRDPVLDLTKVQRPTNMSGGTYTFRPSIRKCIVRSSNKKVISLLTRSYTTGATTYNLGSSIVDIDDYAMRIRGVFEVSGTYPENRITMSIDHSAYTIVTDVNGDGYVWEDTTGIVYSVDKHKPAFYFPPAAGATRRGGPSKIRVMVDITIPKLYAAQTNDLTIQVNAQGRNVYSSSGRGTGSTTGAWTNVSWSFIGALEQSTTTADDPQFDQRTDDVAYYSGNDNNSIEQLIELVYSNSHTYSIGNLKVYNGSTWITSTGWTKNAPGTGIAIQRLLAQQSAAIHETARKVLRTQIRGNMESWHSLQYSSVFYMFLGGKFTAQPAVWDGEWIEIGYANTGTQLTTSGTTNETVDPVDWLKLNTNNLKRDVAAQQMGMDIPAVITDGLLNNTSTAPAASPTNGLRYIMTVVYDSATATWNPDIRTPSQLVSNTRDVNIDCGTFDGDGRAQQLMIDCGTF